MKRAKALLAILGIYILAFVVGFFATMHIDNFMLRLFLFDVCATVVTFIFSVALKNSSVYDPYWSVTPLLLVAWIFLEAGTFSVMHVLFLIAFLLWGIRLTVNWITVFHDFSYEDWRYRMFREKNGPVMWFIINLGGIHMVPTLVVFAGMLPIFEIAKIEIGLLSIPGIIIVLLGTTLEFLADRDMHRFLNNNANSAEKMTVCREGLWNFSRHPNYLGEISVWVGTFLVMLPYAMDKWFYGIGALSIIVLFNAASIPMMEKRQLSRRADYINYRKETSRLFILPHKKA